MPTTSDHAPSSIRMRSLAWLLAGLVPGVLVLAGCQSKPAVTADKPVAIVSEPLAVATDDVTPPPPVIAGVNGEAPLPAQKNLWDRIRAGFRFDLAQDNPRIAAQRNWYLRNPQYLDRVIARGSRYLHYIVDEAEARGMPLELALLPVVESAFDPYAYSHADAAGPWQFIPSTGRIYGLKQDWWYDGRRDIEQSTRAALDYLERLAARFDGDYYKALASYNAGAGTVSRAIKRNQRAGKKTDYWSLKVPQETSAYVPKLVALAQIVQDPAKYGVRLNPVPDEPRFTQVEVGRQIDLARAAELADMPLTELYLYNPGHNRWATDPQGRHTLLVPVELADGFRQVLAGTPEGQFTPAKKYDVIAGDTIASIAAAHGVSVDMLRVVNNLSGDEVVPGETLRIPQPHRALAANESSYEPRILALNSGATRAAVRKTTYVVRSGDTLSGIARKQGVGLRDLARWNDIPVSKPLRVGQKLVVQRKGAAPVATVAGKRSSDEKRVTHTVKPGETLSGLARKFKVSVHDIARWNDFSAKRQLRIGEVVKLYID
ncbi:MAG: LysM peptidoglycan-binding domain-containing protein [Gammaproteobacteria bacterium]